MRGSAVVLILACALSAGCAAQTPQARAAEYKRVVDVTRGVCVAVALDFEAPTDHDTIARCGALRGVP